MNNKKVNKILCVFVLGIFILFFASPSIFAMTSNYSGGGAEFNEDNNSGILEKVGSFIQDFLLGALGKAIAGVSWCIEKIGAWVVSLLTNGGPKVFPWADKVIFNSMPLLDINFINPSQNSLFYSKDEFTLIGTSIRNIYFTGLSIGLGFFGIIVAVMGMRLAVASIASEKAKYKEAIVTWLTALVLLFAMHYIISFVFYINEQLVEVASQIVNNQISSASDVKTVANLGEYFRDKAFGEWNTDSFISAILYGVFIVQSLMFFYAYVKRMFYVVILAVISPFVVVYDFMKKAIF